MNDKWNRYLDDALPKVRCEAVEEEKRIAHVSFVDGTFKNFSDVCICETMKENPDLMMLVEKDEARTITIIPLSSIKYISYSTEAQ